MNIELKTNEQLTAGTKADAIAYAISLSASLPNNFRNIPAVAEIAEIPASTGTDGIITPAVPAVPAVPARSILEQLQSLPEYAAYKAACDAIDAKNEADEKTYESNPEFSGILKAKESAEKFRTDNKDAIAKIDALNTERIAVVTKMSARGTSPTALKALKASTQAIDSQIETLEAGLQYPADYDLSFEDVPTFTPTQYPDIDGFFPNGISLNAPASFIFGRKAVKRMAGASGTSTPKGSGTFDGDKVLALHAAGKRNSEIMHELGIDSNNKITTFLKSKGFEPNRKA